MKQLFVFVLLFISCNLFSQDYRPMAVEGATWLYASYYYETPTYSGYQIQGDSLINGQEYKVIYNLDIERNENDSIEYELKTDYPLGFLRDDIQEKKVYIIYTDIAPKPYMINCTSYDHDTIREYMIYDFNLEVGEYVAGCDAGNSSSLKEITSVTRFSYEVLAYDFGGGNYASILEQIGSFKGIFGLDDIFYTAASWTELLSYCISDEPGCPYYLGPLSNEEITKNDKIKVYPNPTSSYFHLESEVDKIQSISIYTLTGQKVYSRSEINKIVVDIEVADISTSGNLFAIIELENGILTRKHIVVNR